MSLLAWQRAFRAEIAASDDDGPPRSTGMAIYREAYRGRLAAALASSFERTRRWVGDEPFGTAAAHYILTHPPRDWTLDSYGADFPALLSDLFADNPEAGELAWFEWHLQQAFAAGDRPSLDAGRLAAAALDPQDWHALRLTPAAGFASRRIETGCVALWQALADGDGGRADAAAPADRWLTVWRHADQPRFRLLAEDEYALLTVVVAGVPLGTALADCSALADEQTETRIAGWLAQWLSEGILSDFAVTDGAQIPRSATRRSACA